MLVPLVWFEESALIPEETAKKFKSLYTDRIRLFNIVLTSLFLAALGLIAVDLRLIASHYANAYSRHFKISACKDKFIPKGGEGKSIANSSSSDSSSSLNTEDKTFDNFPSEKLLTAYQQPLLSSSPATTITASPSSDSSGSRLDGNLLANDQNKSVEFAVHYNDTLLLFNGQQQQQQQRRPGKGSSSLENSETNRRQETRVRSLKKQKNSSSGSDSSANSSASSNEAESGRTSTSTLPEHLM